MKRLTAIEIAEGALLADVAVIFQLIWTYLPLPGLFFRFLIPVVFSIIVLRRNLSTGLIALGVALFVATVVTGPWVVTLAYFCLEGLGGLFWGHALKRGWNHLATLGLGAFCLSTALSALSFLLLVLVLPMSEIVRSYQRTYAFALSTTEFIATHVGLGEAWRVSVLPIVAPLGAAMLAHWWTLLIAASIAFAVPVVVVTYTMTNVLVRLLGYDVAPFPGGFVDRLGKQVAWRLLREGVRRGLVGRRAGA